MKPSVILYEPLPADLRSQLEARYQVTEVSNLDSHTIASHAAAFSEAVGLLGSGSKVDQALLEQMPALRACSTISVGYDLFDLDALDARRIALMHTPTVLTETVADTVFALILASARRVTELDSWVKAGEWKKVLALNTLVLMCTIKLWVLLAWAVSGWPSHNVLITALV